MFSVEVPAYRYNLRTGSNVWMNRSAQSFFGYNQKELHAMGGNILTELVHQDDVSIAAAHLEQARKLQEGDAACYIIRVWPRDGLHPKFAQICHYCVEHDGEECVELEGYVKEISVGEYDARKLLDKVVPSGNLILHYQPICDLETGELHGYEALARLKRGSNIYGPGVFLPYLDGQLEELWVAQQVNQISSALDQLPEPLWVSMNACQAVLNTSLLPQLFDGYRHIGRVGLEVLESISLSEPVILDTLAALNCMGVTLKADDVGDEHYGGLDRLLQQNLFNAVKLDGNLTRRVLKDEHIANVTRHIIEMAREASLTVIGEWITEEAQLDWLVQHGCQLGQGELFGLAAPLPEQSTC